MSDLKAAVEAAGTSWDKVRTCMGSDHVKRRIAQDMAKAQAYGISGTPATVILDDKTGEHRLVQGLREAQDILAEIERMEDGE
ncbi:MAG: DsbA family protein [Hyphomicrobiales bacterium]